MVVCVHASLEGLLTSSFESEFKNIVTMAGEMPQLLRALVALPKDLGSICHTLIEVHNICNSNPRGSDVLFWPLRTLHECGVCFTCGQNTHTGENK